MTAPLRVGLLGAGRWGKIYIRSIAGMPEIELVAVASRNDETAALVPPGCRVSRDWREIVGAADVEAVIIATPPELHFAMAEMALNAGKPALVEKPFTYDLAEAEALIRLALSRNVCLMVEHTHLFAPAFRALQAALPALGPIQRVAGRGQSEGPFRDIRVLWDWAPHDISMAVALLGTPLATAAARRETRPGTLNAETIAIDLTFAGGVKADLVVSNITAPKRRWLEVTCAGGSLTYDNLADDKLVETSPGGVRKTLAFLPVPPLTVALQEFAAAARRPPEAAALEFALKVMRVLAHCESLIAAQP